MDRFSLGSLTDVPGIQVGHYQRQGRGWLTGTTTVFAPDGAVAAVDVRGGGPGTRETDALAAGNLVDRVHAVCLSGGSAYGLATADGVMAELEARQLGVPVGLAPHEIVPVVPTAVIFDLGRGGRFDRRPTPEFGQRALKAARRTSRRGSIGAGTGAQSGGIRGGVGMASAQVTIGAHTVTVGALMVVNSSGSAIDPATGLPYVPVAGIQSPSEDERTAVATALQTAWASPPLNTTIGVIATDAALSRPEAGRMALSGHDGLARAIRPAHGLMDGDTIFGLSTGTVAIETGDVDMDRSGTLRPFLLNTLFAVAADLVALACTDAVVSASPTDSVPSWASLCPHGVIERP